MTNPYYTDTFTGQAGQTARAEAVDTELAGVQAGFDGVFVDIQRGIKAPTGEVLNDLPAAASRMNTWLRFDANGQPLTVNAPFNFRGLWQPLTVYFVGDVVQISTHGDLVYNTVQHTSALTYATDAVNWVTFIPLAGIQYLNYRVVTASGTSALTKGDAVFADSSAGNMTLTLPSDAVLGDSPITVTHVGGTLAAGQTITIAAGGSLKIMGNTETSILVDKVNASISMSYAGVPYGWRLRTMG